MRGRFRLVLWAQGPSNVWPEENCIDFTKVSYGWAKLILGLPDIVTHKTILSKLKSTITYLVQERSGKRSKGSISAALNEYAQFRLRSAINVIDQNDPHSWEIAKRLATDMVYNIMYRISFHDEGETRWTMDDDEYTLDTAETSQIAYHRRCLMKLSETSRLCYAVLMSTFETVRKYYVDEVNLMGFCHPVDDRDYRKYIKTPIDLRVVYDKIMVSAYDTERAFLSDVQTVWSNCLTYCQGRYDNVVVEMQTLSKIFEGEYEKVFNNDGSSSKNTKSKAPYDEWFGFPPWVRSFENGLCWVCNCAASKSNPVIICEECDGEFHLHCVKPRLKKVPKNDFICVYSKKNDAYTSLAKRSKLPKESQLAMIQEEAARSQRYIGTNHKKYCWYARAIDG